LSLYVAYITTSSPFVQRVWIVLEAKGIPYQYIEVDQLKKPQALLEINPAGLVPALCSNNFSMSDSTVLLEYASITNRGGDFANISQ
jgi:glutathione S-transferase